MATRCEFCGKGPKAGRTYAHRGMAKAKGGVGIKVTGKTNRMIRANIQVVRLRKSNGTVYTAHVCARCLRTGLRDGTIEKAGRRSARWKPPGTEAEGEQVAVPVAEAKPETPEPDSEPESDPDSEAEDT